ncbi:hypothetical protein FJZ19_02055 [Candidatus Pacearchaeota archaeon]|nr:hypothetical protein [Candidatus Pacearchaeota archaeon]
MSGFSNPAEEAMQLRDANLNRNIAVSIIQSKLEKLSEGVLDAISYIIIPLTVPIFVGAMYIAALYERGDTNHPVVKLCDCVYNIYERVKQDNHNQWGVSRERIEAANRRRREERARYEKYYRDARISLT